MIAALIAELRALVAGWTSNCSTPCGCAVSEFAEDILDVLADVEVAPTADRDEVAEVLCQPYATDPYSLADALLARFDIRRKA